MPTPGRLQSALIGEYKSMIFEPILEVPQVDGDYGQAVVHGISSAKASSPQLAYAPISPELMELAYVEITPLIEAWAGCRLERSWGYGIRSYGPGSKLHVHRDRVDTHVVSCIVHVDDDAPASWPLDFVDHEGQLHEVCFRPGQMLFYESLCPHARVQPFNGKYYRNMYFHWRPVDWDPSPYSGFRCKFSSLEEAQQDCIQLATSGCELIPQDWKEWLRLNFSRGCDRQGMIERAQRDGGFSPSVLEAFLDRLGEDNGVTLADATETKFDSANLADQDSTSVLSWLQWFEAPLTKPDHAPRAWKLDTALAQIYELPDLLSREDCELLIGAINRQLVPSSVTRGESAYRTSRTCHLHDSDSGLSARIDQYLSSLLGVDPSLSEPLQGQCYGPGQYFKEHTDWFAPGTEEFSEHAHPGGQRTWTVMIYLNTVQRGGKTCFKHLNRCYSPIQGFALAWNNLMADGSPNPYTLHEAMPVEEGEKWVITKWFRALPGRNG
ncbi:prolyl hydroxylase family protein [Synechococcus sp. HK05]|uniref:prolyl hydroxylase family protein n=1 Tax=Synechococcus sp. HK05 TaxID=2725975 RepID=UPI0034CDB9A6